MNPGGCINRNIQFFTQSAYCFDMVRMIMRNKYRTYHFHADTCFFQSFFYRPYCNAGVDEYSIFFCAYIITVAAASTGKAYKFYFHPNLLNYKKAVAFKKSDGKYTKNSQKNGKIWINKVSVWY